MEETLDGELCNGQKLTYGKYRMNKRKTEFIVSETARVAPSVQRRRRRSR